MEDLDTPIYDEVLQITYKVSDDNLGKGKKKPKQEKKEFIDLFYSKQFIKLYFSKTK